MPSKPAWAEATCALGWGARWRGFERARVKLTLQVGEGDIEIQHGHLGEKRGRATSIRPERNSDARNEASSVWHQV